jgi:hypothetical protein
VIGITAAGRIGLTWNTFGEHPNSTCYPIIPKWYVIPLSIVTSICLQWTNPLAITLIYIFATHSW